MGLMNGLARGLSAAGYAAADLYSKKALDEQRAELEIEKALRVADATEARKAAPMERFSGLMRAKRDEQVPVTADPVTVSTSEGAKSAGLKDGLVGMTREEVAAYKNPEMLAQYDRQMKEDQRLAEEKVAGKTRSRTQEEAVKAALDEALMTDPQAFTAGHALVKPDMKEALELRKLEFQERKADKDREQRDRSDDKRFEAMLLRMEKMGAKEGGDKTAMIQNVEYLRGLGYPPEKIEKFIFDKKELPLEDVAAKILAGDKYGEMTPEQAAQKAIALQKALTNPGKTTAAPKPLGTLPDGAKQIGTSGGKPVYQTPDGKKYIAN